MAKWARERMDVLIAREGPQYQKAYFASFPSDVWPLPVVEEETEEGTFLVLKNGERILADDHHFRKADFDITKVPKKEESEMTWEEKILKRLEDEREALFKKSMAT